MALDTGGLSGDALKKAKAYNDALLRAEKSMKNQEKMAGQIGQAFLGIDGSDFFRSLTEDEMSQKMSELNDITKSLNQQAESVGENLNSTFQKMMESSGFANTSAKELSDSLNIGEDSAQKMVDAMKDGNISSSGIADIIKDMGDDAESLVDTIVNKGNFEENLVNQFKQTFEELQSIDDELVVTNDRMNDINESVFSIRKGFAAVGSNLTKDFNLTGLMDSLMEFDEQIKSAQIETGINLTENTTQMAMLTSETARFGMNIQDTTQLMGDLGTELRTANFETISKATEDLASMQKATGLSSQGVAKLTKEFVMFGKSSEDVADYAGEVMQEAQMFGLNGREIMEDIADNMVRMRTMGFTGGEQSLKKMVMEAKRLGIEVDSVFNVAEKARNIEGAMEMAAELQLAGGSFAQIDPMQLLSAAREGPDAMMDILKQMGSDIGHFNEDNEFKIDPVDKDRLQMVADSTGLTMEELTNSIAKQADDNRKLNLLPPSLFGADLTEEEKDFLMNATKIGENGALELNADVGGISELQNLTQEQIAAEMEAKTTEKDFLDKQAAQNMSFQETKEALMASVTNLFSVFQPVLQAVTDFLNWVNQLGPTMKYIIGGLIVGLKMFFGPAKAYMQGFHMGRGFNSAVSGAKGFLGKMKDKVGSIFKRKGKDIATSKSTLPDTKGAAASKGAGGGLKSLAKGLMAMGNAKAAAGAGVLLLAVPGLVAMVPAIPGLLLMGLVGKMGKLVTFGFATIARGFGILGNNLKNVLLGSLAMAIIGASVIPFAFALSMMADVSWETILAGLTFMTLAAGIVIGMGALFATGGGAVAMVLGALAMGIIAGAVLIFAYALQELVGPAEAFQGVGFGWIFELGTALLYAAPGLLYGGLALLAAAPGLALGALALMPMIQIAQMASGVDWSVFAQIGPALSSLSGALLAFSAAGLAGGIMGAIGGMLGGGPLQTLQVLADIAVKASSPMKVMSDAIGGLANNLQKLQTAANNLNVEKLNSLRTIAMSSGGDGGMGGSIERIAEAVLKLTGAASGEGGKGGGGPVRHIVELKLDGKKLKEIEIRDNKYTT